MTESANPLRSEASGNDVATLIPYNWTVENKAHLKVTRVNTTSGVEEVLFLTTDYDVSGINNPAGGNVVMNLPMPSGYDYVVTSNIPLEQATDFTAEQSVTPEKIEQVADKIVRQIKQVQEQVNRAVKLPVTSDDNSDDYISIVAGYAANASASASDAQDSEDAAAIHETNSAASAASAQQALTDVTAIVNGLDIRDQVFLTVANSPYTVTQADNGKMLVWDTSGGNCVVNIATIAGLSLPFVLGIAKRTSDTNSVTYNRGGTDTIEGATSGQIIAQNEKVILRPDTDLSPDQWLKFSYGALAGSDQLKIFTSGQFTAGAVNTLQLDVPYAASSTGLKVFVGAAKVANDEFSYNPANGQISGLYIPVGTQKVICEYVTAVPVNQPANGTVSWATLASALIGTLADALSGAANKLMSMSVFASLKVPSYSQGFLVVENRKATNTSGDAVGTGGTWGDVPINTVVVNTITGASINGSNQVVLPIGEYVVRGWSMASPSNGLAARLYNVTDAAVAIDNSSTEHGLESATSSYNARVNQKAEYVGYLTVTGSAKTFKQQRVTNYATSAPSARNITGLSEIYDRIEFLKVA